MNPTTLASRALIAATLLLLAVGLSSSANASTIRRDCDTRTVAASVDYSFFPFGFICQNINPSSPVKSTSVYLDGYTNNYASSLNGLDGSSDAKYTNVSPGQTLAFKTGFANWRPPRENSPGGPGSTATRDIYVWVTMDANDSLFDDPNPSNSIGNLGTNFGTGGSYTTSTNGSIPVNGQHLDCPGAHGSPIVIAYPNANNITGNTDRSPYWNSTHNGDGKVDCSNEGQMIYWKLSGVSNNQSPDFKFDVKLRGTYPPPGDSGKICVRMNVSVEYAGETQLVDKLGHMAIKSSKECYWIRTSVVEGNIKSHPSLATGKNLEGVHVYYTRNHSCDYAGAWNVVKTDVDGNYKFYNASGDQFCVRPEATTTATVPGGTTYNSPERLKQDYNGANYDYGGASPDDGSDVVNRNYFYKPIPVAPTIDKDKGGRGTVIAPDGRTVNCTGTITPDPLSVCDPDTLRPGDSVTFYITVKNSIDANQNVNIQDWIPLNIDPASVSAANVSLVEDGNGPLNWFVSGSPDPFAAVQQYSYGNRDISTNFTGDYSSGFSSGSGSSLPRFSFTFSRLPAYSEVLIEWTGTVKSANNIGVYPGSPNDYRYCPGVNSTTYDNPNRVLTECEDRATGLQGVSNAVEVESPTGGFIKGFSNITYNPVPSSFNQAAKTIGSGLTPDENGNIIIDPNDPSTASNMPISSTFGRDTNMGPIPNMTIDDQAGPADLDSHIINIDLTGSGGANLVGASNRIVRWTGQDLRGSGAIDSNTFTFRAGVNPATPIGTKIYNTTRACAPKYWEAGHAPFCIDTNKVGVIVANIINPYLVGDRGDVRAGQTCTAATSSKAYGPVGSSNNKGNYTVTATGSITNFGAGVGKPEYGVNCQPDLVGSANILATTPGKFKAFNTWVPVASQSQYDGKVVTSGTIDIPANTTIKGRWTLFVDGDVHILGNLTYDYGSVTSLNGTPSFGIIATGNISIDPSATQLNGYFYARGKINTCQRADGATLTTGLSVADCRNRLVVNGLLMANGLQFNRTYVNKTTSGNVTTQIIGDDFSSEYAKMIGQLYAATPPAFSTVTKTYNPPQYLQEAPARY